MTIEFNCKFCGKILRTGDDKAGRQAKCPSCGETINVPAETGAEEDHETFDDPPAAPAPRKSSRKKGSQSKPRSKAQDFVDDVDPYDDEDYDDGYEDDGYDDDPYDDDPAPRRRSQRMKNCPVCGAQVKAKALKCRHCGEELDDDFDLPSPSSRGQSKRRSSSRRSGHQEVSAGEIISDAWLIYQENMGIMIGCHVLAIIMMGMIYFVSYIAMALMFVGGIAAIGGGGGAGVGVFAILALFVFGCVILVGFSFIQVGLKLSIFNIVTGKGGEISDLFQGVRICCDSLAPAFCLASLICWVPCCVLYRD